MMRTTVLLSLVGCTLATTGFDAIGAITTTQMTCMHSHGHSFYIGRIYRSNGVVDNEGIQDMKNAWAGGLTHVDGYIFPCLSCSASAAAQVKTAVDNIHKSGVKYGMIWLDIEIYQWKSDKTTNQNFIQAMANELDALKVNWGIYSSKNNWDNIVGDGWTKMSHKPLWWATYNGQATLTGGFTAFGGWTKPAIHQYTGDSSGPCGFAVDMNVY